MERADNSHRVRNSTPHNNFTNSKSQNETTKFHTDRDFPGGPEAKGACVQSLAPRTTKRSHVPQLRPGAAR